LAKTARFYKCTPLLNKDLSDEQVIEAVFTDENRRNLKALAEEMPDLRTLVEELIETMEILSDENLLRMFVQARKMCKKTG
jgi:hypothetical protein